jgi:hypothetical protein
VQADNASRCVASVRGLVGGVRDHLEDEMRGAAGSKPRRMLADLGEVCIIDAACPIVCRVAPSEYCVVHRRIVPANCRHSAT